MLSPRKSPQRGNPNRVLICNASGASVYSVVANQDTRGTIGWSFQVEKDLDKQAFNTAHELRMTKAQFVRDAVEEKITRTAGNQKK